MTPDLDAPLSPADLVLSCRFALCWLFAASAAGKLRSLSSFEQALDKLSLFGAGARPMIARAVVALELGVLVLLPRLQSQPLHARLLPGQ